MLDARIQMGTQEGVFFRDGNTPTSALGGGVSPPTICFVKKE